MVLFIQPDKTISDQPLPGVQGWLVDDETTDGLASKMKALYPFFNLTVDENGDLTGAEDDAEARAAWEAEQDARQQAAAAALSLDDLALALVEQYEQNLALREELTNTQLALVELYESVTAGGDNNG